MLPCGRDEAGISHDGDADDDDDGVRYMVDKEHDGPLVSMDLKEFVLNVGSRSPTPGGGSVAALTAALVSTLSVNGVARIRCGGGTKDRQPFNGLFFQDDLVKRALERINESGF